MNYAVGLLCLVAFVVIAVVFQAIAIAFGVPSEYFDHEQDVNE